MLRRISFKYTIYEAMNKQQAKDLLGKYLLDKASADEIKLIEHWYMAASRKQGLSNTEADFYDMKALIWADTLKSAGLVEQPVVSSWRKLFWPRIVTAAAAVAAIVFGLWFYHHENILSPKASPKHEIVRNDIAPGRIGATLTLANGKQIILSDANNGELAKQAGVVISKSAEGQLIYEMDGSATQHLSGMTNRLSTAKGETYQIKLPDGTMVWLNAASTLSFSTNLRDKGHKDQRRVGLIGEAYFEVAKDNMRPFVVKTNKQEVEVLGTHFNISAYPDELDTKTTLIEGAVRLNHSTVLKPGEQAVLKESGKISILKTDPTEAIAWKNGYFIFRNESLTDIMKKISRWYDVDIIYKGDISQLEFGAVISRNRNVTEVFKKLELTGSVHFRIEGRRIIVMP